MWTPSGRNLRRASGRKDTQKAMRSLGIRSGVSPMNSPPNPQLARAAEAAMDSLMVTLGDLDRKIGFELGCKVRPADFRLDLAARAQLRC